MSSRKRAGIALAAWVPLAMVALAGCSEPHPAALTDSAFMPDGSAAPIVASRAGAMAPALSPLTLARPATTRPSAAGDTAEAAPAALMIAPALPPVPGAAIAPTARAAAFPAPDAAASPNASADPLYMTLGGVIAEVNGSPIYANTVLSLLNGELAAKAREMDPDSFREFAKTELQRQREASIIDEAEFAAAQLQLSDDDKKLAQQIAIQNRQKLITDCGGSVEQARARIAADGLDFDTYLQQQYRQIMQKVYYERKIVPRIQISAADMRSFYDTYRDRLYSTPSAASFRVIKIDPARIGGPNADAAARQRIEQIRRQALHGADFATLASTENQDQFLKSRAGDPGCPMQRDSYRIDAVDHAVWQLQPGQISPVIASDDAYWLVKLESRTDGQTRPFDDQSVQDDIHNRLWQQQFETLREAVLEEMEGESFVRRDDRLLQAAVDMAMQEYARWHGVRQ